jgi:hypothetical protein
MIARRQSALGRTRKMELQKGLGGSEVAAEIIIFRQISADSAAATQTTPAAKTPGTS